MKHVNPTWLLALLALLSVPLPAFAGESVGLEGGTTRSSVQINIVDRPKVPPVTSHRVDEYCERAEAFFTSGQYDLCVDEATSALVLNYNCIRAFKIRTMAYERLGKYFFAKLDAARAERLAREDARAENDRTEEAVEPTVQKPEELSPCWGPSYEPIKDVAKIDFSRSI